MWSGTFIDPALWRKGERLPKTATVENLKNIVVAQGKANCKAARTCRDAVEMWCGGYSGADRDNDGIPCESVCKSKAQVDAIKAEIGC